jgi:hypothetical protein
MHLDCYTQHRWPQVSPARRAPTAPLPQADAPVAAKRKVSSRSRPRNGASANAATSLRRAPTRQVLARLLDPWLSPRPPFATASLRVRAKIPPLAAPGNLVDDDSSKAFLRCIERGIQRPIGRPSRPRSVVAQWRPARRPFLGGAHRRQGRDKRLHPENGPCDCSSCGTWGGIQIAWSGPTTHRPSAVSTVSSPAEPPTNWPRRWAWPSVTRGTSCCTSRATKMGPSGAVANVGSRGGDLASTRLSLAVAHARVNSLARISRLANDMANRQAASQFATKASERRKL